MDWWLLFYSVLGASLNRRRLVHLVCLSRYYLFTFDASYSQLI